MFSLASANTYYVKPTGSDAANGTSEATAWQHVMKACSTVNAGDTVFIRAGVYDETSNLTSTAWGYPIQSGLVPSRSGAAGAYIVFKGYRGDTRPIIKGKSPSYGAPNTANYRMGVLLNNEHHLIYDSLEFRFGPTGFFLQGGGPHDIIIRNCVIDSMLGLGGAPLDDNSGGIVTYYEQGTRNITVENNEIFACGAWSSGGSHAANYTKYFNTGGMWLYTCDSCLIRNNKIHDVNSGIRFKEEARYSEVYGNTFYNIAYASMWAHSGQRFAYTGPDHVMSRWHHNISYNAAICFNVGEGTGDGVQDDTLLYFYNNTCDCSNSQTWAANGGQTDRYGGIQGIEGGWGRAWFFNNIFYNVPAMNNSNSTTHSGAINIWTARNPIFQVYEDYNMFYGQGTGQYYAINSSAYTLAQWKAASISQMVAGQGAHSVINDPLFSNVSFRNYHLQPGSPALSGGKGGVFTFFPGTSRAQTVTIDSYFGALTTEICDTLFDPILVSPADLATGQINPVTIDVGDINGAYTYKIEIDDNSNFSSLFSSVSSPVSQSDVSGLTASTTYYWRTRGEGCDTSKWSATRTFTMSSCPDTVFDVTLTSPANNATGRTNPVTLDWPDIANATSYTYQVSTTSNFASIFYTNTVTPSTGTVTGMADNTDYYWRVKGINSCDESAYSIARKFTMTGPCIGLAVPTLVSPANGTVNSPINVSFDWNDVSGAANYRIDLSLNSGFSSIAYTSVSSISNASALLLSYGTTYYWRVKAYGCDTTISAIRSFTTAQQQAANSPLTIGVSEGAIDSWGYQYDANGNNGGDENVYISGTTGDKRSCFFLFPTSGVTGTVDSVFFIANRISSGAQQLYFYPLTQGPFIESQVTYNSYSTGNNWSTVGGTYSNCSGKPCDSLTVLGGASANQQVIVKSYSGGLKQIVQEYVNGTRTNNGFFITGPNGFDIILSSTEAANASYRPVLIVYFTIDCTPPSPATLSSPADGAVGVSLTPTLDWSDVATATNYQIEVDNDIGFGSKDGDYQSSASTFTSGSLNPGTIYYWRVRAQNTCDWSSWSSVQSFRTAFSDSCTVITSLPYTVPASNACYCLENPEMSSATDGILTAGKDNIRFRARGAVIDTIDFGTGGGKNFAGIFIGWQSNNVLLENIYVRHSPPSPMDDSNTCVYLAGSHDISTNNLWIEPSGFNGKGIQNNTGGYNFDLYKVYQVKNNVMSYYSRCTHNASTVLLEASTDYNAGNYFAKIHACSLLVSPHNCVSITGGPTYKGKIFIDSSYFSVDARNNYYAYPSGVDNACFSSGDPMALDILGAGPGSRISYNKIYPGTQYEGGQGLMLQNLVGTAQDSVLVFGNDITASSGPNDIHGMGLMSALYMRYVPGNANTGSEYVAIKDNIFTGIVDADTNTSFRGRWGEVWSLILGGGMTGPNVNDVFRNIDFTRNKVQLLATGQYHAGDIEAAAIGYGNTDSSFAPFSGGKNIKFQDNHYVSPRVVIKLSNLRGTPGNNMFSYRDSIEALQDNDSVITFDNRGAYTYHATNNTLRDPIWMGYATDNDVKYSAVGATSADTYLGQSVKYEETINVTVNSFAGVPQTNANIWVLNAYGATIASGQTNGSGVFSQPVMYKYKAKDNITNDSYINQDSTYSPFTIVAKKGTDSTSGTLSVSSSNNAITLTFAQPIITNLQIAYVVDTDTTFAGNVNDTSMINFLKNDMDYIVYVISDDSARAITSVNAYDGYFLSAKISLTTGQNFDNLRPTTKGVFIADPVLYNDFDVASSVVSSPSIYLLGTEWRLSKIDSTWVTGQMFPEIYFLFSSNSGANLFTGLPSGAKVLFAPTTHPNWDGTLGTPDSSFCYTIETGVGLATSGTAAGRRAVGLCFNPFMTGSTLSSGGYCHPRELLGNMVSWVFSDQTNSYSVGYACFSFDRQELRQSWAEFGGHDPQMFAAGRIGYDYGPGLIFLDIPEYQRKVLPGYKVDSLVWTYPYNGAGIDSPPAGDQYSGFDFWEHFYAIDPSYNWQSCVIDSTQYDPVRADSTTILSVVNNSTVVLNKSIYLSTQYIPAYGSFFRVKTGVAAGQQVGITRIGPNGTTLKDTVFLATPIASMQAGDNVKLFGRVRNWANRYNAVNDTVGGNIVPWSAKNLVGGIDYLIPALDSFRFNASTFPQTTGVARFVFPGSAFNNWNGIIGKSTNIGTFQDSMDVELAPRAVNSPRESNHQSFELYTSLQGEPVLNPIGPRSVNENATLQFSISGYDPDGQTVTMSVVGSLLVNSTFSDLGGGVGVFTFNPSTDQIGVHTITFRCSDGTLYDDETVTITVIDIGAPPFVLNPTTDKSVQENSLLNFVVSTSNFTSPIPTITCNNLPSGATFVDQTNGTAIFNWTPNYTQSGVYNIIIEAQDGTTFPKDTVTITVTNLNRAPVLASIGSRSGNEGQLLTFAFSATDLDNETLTFTTINLPAGASITNLSNGNAQLDWVPGFSQAGVYNVTFAVSDGIASDNEVVQITINDVGGTSTVSIAGTTNVEDSYLRPSVPNANYSNYTGGSHGMYVFVNGANIGKGIVRFKNIATILPVNAYITNAYIKFTMFQFFRIGTLRAARVYQPWVEGNSNGGTTSGVSFNHFDISGAKLFTIAGCNSSADPPVGQDNLAGTVGTHYDRAATESGAIQITATGVYNMNLNTALVQGWRDGSMANNGVLLYTTDGDFTLYQSETANSADRIELVIEYTTVVNQPSNYKRHPLKGFSQGVIR